jgi:hypothetical protein
MILSIHLAKRGGEVKCSQIFFTAHSCKNFLKPPRVAARPYGNKNKNVIGDAGILSIVDGLKANHHN